MQPRHAVSVWSEGWYVVPHEVTWRDLDAAGHVNNAVFFTFFEWARTRYWFALNGTTPSLENLGFIVARAECDFRRELSLMERIEICVRISEMRQSSFDFVYQIRLSGSGEVAATGKVVMVLYSWTDRSKLTIPEELRVRVRRFQQEEG
jgi:acyl-CoA thioester hydrolase